MTDRVGQQLFTYQGHSTYVNAVTWSPDSKRIASGGGDKTVQVWDASNGNTLLTYRGHSDVVQSVAWSPDSRYVASASNDLTVQICSVA